MEDVKLFIYSPVDPVASKFTGQLLTRIRSFHHSISQEPNADAFARRFMNRLVLKDPTVAAAIIVHEGQVVAHVIAEIVADEDEKVVFVLQCEVSKGWPGLVDKLLKEGDNWGKSVGAKSMRLEVGEDQDEKTWTRLYGHYGFRVVSRVMEREITK